MKKKFLGLAVLGLLTMCGIGLGATHNIAAVHADDEISVESNSEESLISEESEEDESEEESVVVSSCSVVLPKLEHGDISADKLEGEVGEVVTLSIEPELLYVVKTTTVNGVTLAEDKETKGVYSFALVEGENVVSVDIVIDEELLGVFSTMVEQAKNKDWTHLFSVENVLVIVKWVLDGGILIAVITYFVKDKKLSQKVIDAVQEIIGKIIPEKTKETVLGAVKEEIEPLFRSMMANDVDIMKTMNVFAKCMALSQENTPESRRAILDELSNLKVGDQNTINEIKKYIEDFVNNERKSFEDAMNNLNKISEKNSQIIEQNHEEENHEEKEENEKDANKHYDGTSI